MSKKKDANELTLEEHFAELKRRILFVIGLLIVIFALCLWKSRDVLTLFLKQGREAGYTMIALSPQETLIQQLRVCFTAGILIASPVIVYELMMFAAPAVGRAYRRKFWGLVFIGAALFVAGICFAVYILFPVVLSYMKDITTQSDVLLEISVSNYISFFLTMTLVIGLVFEIPLASLLLSGAGLITATGMRKHRKIMIIVILIVAAVITPPDVVSQIMVAVPMIGLYEISIFLCGAMEKKRRGKEADIEDRDNGAGPDNNSGNGTDQARQA